MSEKSRARHLMRIFPFTYQQALQRVRSCGQAAYELAKEKEMALKLADEEICARDTARRPVPLEKEEPQ